MLIFTIVIFLTKVSQSKIKCFVDEQGNGAYIGWLTGYSKKHQMEGHAWVLMSNNEHCVNLVVVISLRYFQQSCGTFQIYTMCTKGEMRAVVRMMERGTSYSASYL